MTPIQFVLTPLAILLVFYMYMLTRFKYVRRPMFYLWGTIGVASGLALGGIVLPFVDPAGFFARMVEVGANLAAVFAFACIVLACYGGQLPERLPQGRRTESIDEDELPEFLEEASQAQQRDQ